MLQATAGPFIDIELGNRASTGALRSQAIVFKLESMTFLLPLPHVTSSVMGLLGREQRHSGQIRVLYVT